jgi:hypothetical protein
MGTILAGPHRTGVQVSHASRKMVTPNPPTLALVLRCSAPTLNKIYRWLTHTSLLSIPEVTCVQVSNNLFSNQQPGTYTAAHARSALLSHHAVRIHGRKTARRSPACNKSRNNTRLLGPPGVMGRHMDVVGHSLQSANLYRHLLVGIRHECRHPNTGYRWLI